MRRESDYLVFKVFVVIILILWGMFEMSTCMEYKDTPAGEVPMWVYWI